MSVKILKDFFELGQSEPQSARRRRRPFVTGNSRDDVFSKWQKSWPWENLLDFANQKLERNSNLIFVLENTQTASVNSTFHITWFETEKIGKNDVPKIEHLEKNHEKNFKKNPT